MTKAHSLRTLVVFISCLLLAGGAFAAEMAGFGDGASWNLDKADFGGVMTISGPDNFSMQKAFGAGEAPSFSVWNKAGYALADGQYKWNITLNAAKAERGQAAPEKAASFSGTFRIEGGSIVVPKASGFGDSDVGFNKDQVFFDDLIVVGSICAGQDCSNGESFGFDTLRLKENNLRIKAQDTSTSASFPTNDWQITFNDSSNGGANKFSIDDIDGGRTPFTIEAAARSQRSYVEDGWRCRHRNEQPCRDSASRGRQHPDAASRAGRLLGFTPQTWDVAGNEANFFIRDATNGSKLPFRIIPGSGNDNALVIQADGDIGMGTNNPAADAALEIRRSDAALTLLQITNNNASAQNTGIRIVNNDATWDIRGNTAGQLSVTQVGTGAVMTIDDADQAVTFNAYSGGGSTLVCMDDNGELIRASGTTCP